MLRSRISCAFPPRRWMSYFSAEFNKMANEGPAKFTATSNSITNIDLDLFVNPDNKPMDLVERLAKLRKQKQCTLVPLLPGIVIKQLLDSTNPQEAISVLRNPTQYGLFIDQFSGCFLMDFLLQHGNAVEAAQVAALLVERGLCNNELIEALALQSFYAYAKDFKPFEPSQDKQPDPKVSDVEKVRVKFIRNYPKDASENTEEYKLGRSMVKIGSGEGSLKEPKQNIALLGYVISGQLAEAASFLAKHNQVFDKETLIAAQGAVESLKLEGSDDLLKSLQESLEKSPKSNAIQGQLESIVKSSAVKFEPKLLADYGEAYQQWAQKFEEAVKNQLEAQSLEERRDHIQKTLSDLEAKRQNLWFFENKDDIDIQIYKKKVYYPKRWFGKKKNPKAVDTFYVPPNISHNT
ncbi:hypothetical protein KR009_010396 [Drosophila setifemur]|nr:hypothetical protein KR009_010396 [Drosophila setifemur]